MEKAATRLIFMRTQEVLEKENKGALERNMTARSRILRSGYTTGACAAAAAKAATSLLLNAGVGVHDLESLPLVEIPFPDGSRVRFTIHSFALEAHTSWQSARASIIKDAGDDPDVTNGAEIAAEVRVLDDSNWLKEAGGDATSGPLPCASPMEPYHMVIRGGKGVGIVTKPGLSVPVGEAAINPVPKDMIRSAVLEALSEGGNPGAIQAIEITISVTDGDELARKTLNPRLGIVGGISILGTSGIVKPLSSEAWTASITASMDVARALNIDEIVVSAGRVSEKAHMRKYHFPVEAYVMMGDYLEFSLLDARNHGFTRIHLCAQWAKMLKIAMATPHTHVRHGAISMSRTVELLTGLGFDIHRNGEFNTAREVFDYLIGAQGFEVSLFRKVCISAKKYAENITGGIPVVHHLVSYAGEIIVSSE